MLPALVAVPLVNALIYGRLVPRHTEATLDCLPPTNRQIGRFLAGDYSGSAVPARHRPTWCRSWSRCGPRDVRLTAYFYMAWMVGGVLDLVGVNMSMSLTVEGAFDAVHPRGELPEGAPEDGHRSYFRARHVAGPARARWD